MQHTFMLGAALDFQVLAVIRHKQADLPIMDTPYQLIKPSIGRFVFQALHSYYATRRTMLQQATDVDPDIFHEATKALESKDANCIRYVSTLSAVEQSLKCRIEGSVDDMCIFCKKCKSSLVHIYWHCPHPTLVQARQALTDPRQQFLLDQVHVLPDHILLGIPASLTICPNSPWWTNQHVDFTPACTHEAKQFFGVDHSFDTAFLTWIDQYKDLNARDAFHLVNGYGKQMPIPFENNDCKISPQANIAQEPDAFSDGSSTHPKLPQFGLATAAVWWPGRSLATNPLTQLEQMYGHVNVLTNGITIAAHLPGYDPSSTRAEILGLILALFSPMACRLAIDSAATLNKAGRIQDWLTRNLTTFSARLPLSVSETLQHQPLGRHFNLCTNGDLWHIMHRQLLHRGPNTIVFVKTKGHALEDHAFLRRHPELRQEAIGNDKADNAAKQARATCFNSHVVRLSDTLAERTGKYTLFIKHVQAIISRVHAASQELGQTPAFNLDPDRRVIAVGVTVQHTAPVIPHDLHSIPVQLKASKRLVDEHLTKAGPLMIGFAQLLSHHRFATSPSCSGFTWMEFLLLSIAASPNPAAVFTSGSAEPARKLMHLVREFTNKAKQYLKFAYTPEFGNHFHVTHMMPNRLAHYGYVNRTPLTSIHIHLHEEVARALNATMLNLQSQLT